MSGGTIHCQMANGVALLEIDNPPANTLGGAMRALLVQRIAEIEADAAVRAIVITGRGNAFCSGDDLREQEAAQKKTGVARLAHFGDFGRAVERLETSRLPVIGAINGWCVGGGLELALGCDIRIASVAARFVCAGVNVGLIASAWRLPRLIGVARAKHMLLTGLPQDAAAAEQFGLVTAIHPAEKLTREAMALAMRIASRAPLAVEATKRTASRAPDLSAKNAAKLIAREIAVLGRSKDHRAALAAFREKREPKFTRS